MHVFRSDGATVQRYASAEEIIDNFIPVRLDTYHRRKAAQVAALSDQVKFQCLVLSLIYSPLQQHIPDIDE